MLLRIVFVVTSLTLLSMSAQAQQKIVLRSLQEVESAEFKFNNYQITSANGHQITWDQVYSGMVAEDQQQKFDELLREIGVPLYRIQHRMRIGDFDSLGSVIKNLELKFAEESATAANCRTMFVLNLARFCDSMGAGKHEQATIHLLTLSEMLTEFHDQLKSEQMPQGLTIGEIEQCFVPSLLPLWFDRNRAAAAWKQIPSHQKDNWKDWSDGGLIYAASLAIASQQTNVEEALAELDRRSSTMKDSWLPILLAYQEVTAGRPLRNVSALQKKVKNLEDSPRAVAQYLLGVAAGLQEQRFDEGILNLLYIPAVFGEQLPHLSAAALLEASKLAAKAGNLSEAKKLQNELKNRYPNIQHAQQSQLK